MKKFFWGILIFLVIIAILQISLFVIINTKGKNILADRIEEFLGLRPEIGSLNLRFPLILEITDFNFKNLSFAKAEISLGSYNPFTSALSLKRVYFDKLNFQIVRGKDEISVAPIYSKKPLKEVESAQEEPAQGALPGEKAAKTDKAKDFVIKIKDFYLQNGRVNYLDQSGENKIDLTFSDINLKVHNFFYPKLTKSYFGLNASLKTPEEASQDLIVAEGWIDYFNKNMDVDLAVNSFQYNDFSGYYPSFWQPENLGIKKATISVDARLDAKDNDLTIDSAFILDDIEFSPIADRDQKNISRQRFVKTVVGLLKDEQGVSKIRIKLTTKMDRPGLNFKTIGKSFEKSLPIGPNVITGELIHKTGDMVKEGVGKAKDLPKDTIGVTIETIKEAINKVKDAFTGSEN